jgi:diguanylate cyclase (GGDEF)-like protein/PAS domain S-box-containing protein
MTISEAPINVLFVEDSDADVELELRALARDGLNILSRRVDSEPALRSELTTVLPDAILSDFSMPGFDGLQALRLVREIAPRVPFIFVSGTIGEERAIEAIRNGATDYVLKNNLRRLSTSVRRALTEAAERERVQVAEAERARLVEIMEATSDYVGMSDPDGRQIYLNTAGRNLVGIPEREVHGKPILSIYPEWARRVIEEQARPTAARAGIWQGETAMLAPNGAEVPVSQVVIAHRNPDGSVRFYSTIARDISERKAYEARIQHLANYDAMSGLPNRTLLADRAAQAIVHARRQGRVCGLIAVNVDRFKLVNESYGPATADALLKAVGERLRSAVRDGDTVARLAGDAFAVLASSLARPDDVLHAVRKIRDVAAAPFHIDGRELRIELSIGASIFPRDGEEFDLLLRNADAAMNRVKAAGGGGFQFYAAAMTREATDRVEIEAALHGAARRGEVQLHYQPQVELASGRVIAVEALMRWTHPQRGPVSPGQFIPIAEQSDLIVSLGEWALHEGCRQLAAWPDPDLRMAINVSPRQFRSPGFAESVAKALRASGIEGRRLELELTEGVLIEDREQAVSILEQLKRTGVMIAVDDFGTGYSSLSYLSGLPVDCLKIDRSFVVAVEKGTRDAAIARAIISLAHSLGVRVLAEGVETQAQADFLRAHACDEAQGYLFARPCSAGDAARLIAAPSLPLAKATRTEEAQ